MLPIIARILKGMNPQTFKKLYDDGIYSEEIAEEERKSQKGKATYHRGSTSNTRTADVNRVITNRKFSNFNQPLSKVFKRLERQGLLKPEPPRFPPNRNSPNYNPDAYCKFHQTAGHFTDNCLKLKHTIQDLIKAGKVTDPDNRQPSTKHNPLPNYNRVPPPN